MNTKFSAFSSFCVLAFVLYFGLSACSQESGGHVTVVIGGGPAGLSAAIEATPGDVILIEQGAVLGGSARYSAAITALPPKGASMGLPSQYVDGVQPDVIDWTASLGQPWEPAENPLKDAMILRRPVGGGSALVSVLEAEARRRGVSVRTGTEVRSLDKGERWSLGLADGRILQADSVIVATGGFAGELTRVRAIRPGTAKLIRGVPRWADGRGADLVLAAGGQQHTPAGVLLYGHGVPKPSDPEQALMFLGAEGAVWLDGTGQPIAPRTPRGEGAALGPSGTGWILLGKAGIESLMLADPLEEGPIDAPALVARAGWGALSVTALAQRIGIPLSAAGSLSCPCAALPIRPTTSKSLTGIVTDAKGHVLDVAGQPIVGLFAAGEVAGFGGGRHPPVDSTMVASAILSGRTVGREARASR